MKYIIIDWASNVCFNSDLQNFKNLDEASEALDFYLRKLYGEHCDLEYERQEYTITQVTQKDKIMGNVLYTFN